VKSLVKEAMENLALPEFSSAARLVPNDKYMQGSYCQSSLLLVSLLLYVRLSATLRIPHSVPTDRSSCLLLFSVAS
jgi:hypothetical protein